MYIFVCKGITESQVRELGQTGMTCPQALSASLELDDEDNCCGRCLDNIQEFVAIATNGAHTSLHEPVRRRA